ncbi:hypothetical protein KJ992_03135 [Patescibacteria group bacterium]|nr:hypothetical protein [Patescibacteria group bacterium]MBU1778625.1 hypothetical protein [Patescibacteria group bacterium]MBU2415917.1 hypothetical protein [Patescibacteria group bacterium]
MDLIQGELRAAKICDLPLIVESEVNISSGQFLYCPKCCGLRKIEVDKHLLVRFINCMTCGTTLIQSMYLV